MKKQFRKCILILTAVIAITACKGMQSEAASWTKANYNVKTAGSVYIYKKDIAKTKYRASRLKKGTKVKILKISKYGWGRIKYKGKTRYIQMYRTVPIWSNVKKDRQVSKKAAIYSKTEAVSKYKTKTLQAGTVVYVVKKSSDGWSRITYGGKTRYIKTKYLKNVGTVVTAPNASAGSTPDVVKESYAFTISSTVHSKITVTDASGKNIISGSAIQAGTKLTAKIEVAAGYQFQGYTGASTSTSKTVTFTMPEHESGLCARIVRSNAGAKSYACMKDSFKLGVIYAVVRQEGGASYEGQAAVMTTVMNRMESPAWKGRGADPYQQLTAKSQFADVMDNSGKAVAAKYKNNVNANTVRAVNDVLNGLRTHDCCSFRTATTYYKTRYPYGYDICGNWFFN